MLVVQSCPTLWDPMNFSPPGTSVPGIFQASILEWVAISSSRGSSWPRDGTWISRDQTWISCIAGRYFTNWATGEVFKTAFQYTLKMLVAQSSTLCDPMDCSPPGSPVHGILQGRMLEWDTTPNSRGSSWLRDWTWVSHIAGRFFNIWIHQGIHSVQFSHSVMSDSLWPHGLQHARLPCPSPTPWACSNSCSSS